MLLLKRGVKGFDASKAVWKLWIEIEAMQFSIHLKKYY
jgi:hypothetical protein